MRCALHQKPRAPVDTTHFCGFQLPDGATIASGETATMSGLAWSWETSDPLIFVLTAGMSEYW